MQIFQQLLCAEITELPAYLIKQAQLCCYTEIFHAPWTCGHMSAMAASAKSDTSTCIDFCASCHSMAAGCTHAQSGLRLRLRLADVVHGQQSVNKVACARGLHAALTVRACCQCISGRMLEGV